MVRHVPVLSIAGCFALGAFTIALLSGLSAGRATAEILEAGLVSMFVCWLVGFAVGKTAEVALCEHIERYESENVPPDSMRVEGALEGDVGAEAS